MGFTSSIIKFLKALKCGKFFRYASKEIININGGLYILSNTYVKFYIPEQEMVC